MGDVHRAYMSVYALESPVRKEIRRRKISAYFECDMPRIPYSSWRSMVTALEALHSRLLLMSLDQSMKQRPLYIAHMSVRVEGSPEERTEGE